MTFRVGQKVVCISTWKLGAVGYGDETGPLKDSIYTIRAIGYLNPAYPDILCVHLHEIANPTRPYSWPSGVIENEPAFSTNKFRPLVDTKSEISFTQGAPKDSKRFDNRRKIKERA